MPATLMSRQANGVQWENVGSRVNQERFDESQHSCDYVSAEEVEYICWSTEKTVIALKMWSSRRSKHLELLLII